MSSRLNQAARRVLPEYVSSVSAATSTVVTVTLPQGFYLALQADAKTHISRGSAASSITVTTDYYYLQADIPEEFYTSASGGDNVIKVLSNSGASKISVSKVG